jgi:hypothetical protein
LGVAAPRRPDPAPLETNDVIIVAGGTALWAVALVVLLVLQAAGSEIHSWWIVMCLEAIALGAIGIRFCSRRQRAIARDHAGTPSP